MSVTRRGSMGMCNVSVSHDWDRHSQLVDQSVGQSVEPRVPVDHASMRLAQACPNYVFISTHEYDHPMIINTHQSANFEMVLVKCRQNVANKSLFLTPYIPTLG